ncbi:MAG: hypothetical protein JNK82_36575 [Myxococcaceae bacterium]|nr:hypothetical protein [Myxococcaceae bacterium]
MPKVRRSAPSDVSTATPPAPITRATSKPTAAAFTNGRADAFKLKDAALRRELKELHGDAAQLEQIPQAVDKLITIFGTARAKPSPGENGHADWVFGEALGAALREAGYSISTGAGAGAMEAPMRGHAKRDEELDAKAGRTIGWEAGEPNRVGANIILPHEQKANPYIDPTNLQTYNLFLFRMQYLFRDGGAQAQPVEGAVSSKLVTPGGFGTIAEHFMYLAMRARGLASEEMVFLSHDDFYQQLNAAFLPFVHDDKEVRDLENVLSGDPKQIVDKLLAMAPAVPASEENIVARMRDDLEKGLVSLDGKPPAIAFFSGEGPRSQEAAPLMEAIAEGAAKAGKPVRIAGSSIGDEAVLRGARKAKPDAEVQAFALHGAALADASYVQVHDPLVLRQLMNTNVEAIVATPESALQLAMLFTTATDIQTGKMAKKPVIVLDPDGKFDALKKQLAASLHSADRRYINLEDLDIFTTVKADPQAALRAMNLAA